MITIEMPEDVREYVLNYQGKMKSTKRLGFYGQEKALFGIVREHKALTEEVTVLKRKIASLQYPQDVEDIEGA